MGVQLLYPVVTARSDAAIFKLEEECRFFSLLEESLAYF